MIVADVIRSEGVASAFRRASERISESFRFTRLPRTPILNVAMNPVGARFGGIGIQLMARLRVERTLRDVALVPFARLREGLARTGAKAIHIEGTSGFDLDPILSLGVDVIVSVHDFSLQGSFERVIFPSEFLRDAYGGKGEVIEPCGPDIPVRPARQECLAHNIAFAGSVARHKGAHLLPELARHVDQLHVFGGAGDHALMRDLRKIRNVRLHGYYRAGTLPSLLARHGIGVVVIPSIVPEAFCLVLSEAWRAGAAVVAFDIGAQAARIRKHGGGLLAPLDSGAAGLAALIPRARNMRTPTAIATPEDAARAHIALYERWGYL